MSTAETEGTEAQVISILRSNASPLSITELAERLTKDVSRRSLQRIVRSLLTDGRLIAKGAGKARRYALAPSVDAADVGPIGEPEPYVTVSTLGAEVRGLVRRPFEHRIPIGYDRGLLEGYTPGTTFYLDAEVRAHLARIGRVEVGEQPAGTYARSILDRLLIDLSWASSHLEGNTYTLLDTQRLIEEGLEAAGKDRIEAQMILNHKAAIELLVEDAASIGFNRYTVLNLHALLSDNLLANPDASGRLRLGLVGITNSVFSPLNLPQEIERLFDVLLAKASAIEDPFEQAFFGMVHIPYLQPFEDVNKRVSRLTANIPLVQRNLCPLSFVEVPKRAYVEGTLGVHELGRVDLLRDVFVWAYERSCHRYTAIRETLAEPDPTRLEYRAQIRDGVASIVRGALAKDTAAVRDWASAEGVAESSVATVTAMIVGDVERLHLGNIARYGLRPSELDRWLDARASKRP